MESDHQSTNQTWQNVVDQQLVRRLTRPLGQPGMTSTRLARTVLLRTQPMANRLPVLTDLAQRWGGVEHQVGREPIVYAQRWRSDRSEAGTVAAQVTQTAERPLVHAVALRQADSTVDRSVRQAIAQASALPRQDLVSSVSRTTRTPDPSDPDRFVLPAGRSVNQRTAGVQTSSAGSAAVSSGNAVQQAPMHIQKMPDDHSKPAAYRGTASEHWLQRKLDPVAVNVAAGEAMASVVGSAETESAFTPSREARSASESPLASNASLFEPPSSRGVKVPADHSLPQAPGRQRITASSPAAGPSRPVVHSGAASEHWLGRKVSPLAMTLAAGTVISTVAWSAGPERAGAAQPASVAPAAPNTPSRVPSTSSGREMQTRDGSPASAPLLPGRNRDSAAPTDTLSSRPTELPSRLSLGLGSRLSGMTPVIQRATSQRLDAETPSRSWQGNGYGSLMPLVLSGPPARAEHRLAMLASDTIPTERATEATASQELTAASIQPAPRAALGSVTDSQTSNASKTDLDDFMDTVLRKLMRRLAVESERRGWQRWP